MKRKRKRDSFMDGGTRLMDLCQPILTLVLACLLLLMMMMYVCLSALSHFSPHIALTLYIVVRSRKPNVHRRLMVMVEDCAKTLHTYIGCTCS